jgi:hypothetical protein
MPAAVMTQPKKRVTTSSEDVCVIQIQARLLSLGGGILLALAILFTTFLLTALFLERTITGQVILFGLLTVAIWMDLRESATERLAMIGRTIKRTSFIGRPVTIRLDDLKELLLVHEGLNMNTGTESITARYRDGREERLPLGPCWRRTDLEAFLSSVEKELGDRKLLEEVR